MYVEQPGRPDAGCIRIASALPASALIYSRFSRLADGRIGVTGARLNHSSPLSANSIAKSYGLQSDERKERTEHSHRRNAGNATAQAYGLVVLSRGFNATGAVMQVVPAPFMCSGRVSRGGHHDHRRTRQHERQQKAPPKHPHRSPLASVWKEIVPRLNRPANDDGPGTCRGH